MVVEVVVADASCQGRLIHGVVAAIVVEVAEVEVKILNLDRPSRANLPLHTAANRPTRQGVVVVVVEIAPDRRRQQML